MTNPSDRIEVITSVQRRGRWSASEKVRMVEAFVRTIKRDYVCVSPSPDAKTVMRQLPAWITHYNEVHPHKALGYRSPPRVQLQLAEVPDRVRSFGGQQHLVASDPDFWPQI